MHTWDGPSSLDRLDDVRPERDAVAELWRDAVVLTVDDRGNFPVAVDQPLLRPSTAAGEYDPARHWLVGRLGTRVWFLTTGDVDGHAAGIREIGGALEPGELEVAMVAVAVAAWHRLEPHCGTCGNVSQVRNAGMSRHCAACARDLFPRTDPAVIVAVTDEDDRLLLAHQGIWAQNRYSVLAGFVEAGESLEQAIHREILEEAGIRLGATRYVGSQPWPMPRSLMLGFTARAVTTDITVDGDEIIAARWFTRDELRAAVAEASVSLPGEASIAYRLVMGWLTAGS